MGKLLEKLSSIKDNQGDPYEFVETTKKCAQHIFLDGYLTGSTLWGVNSENSDVDVILPPDSYLGFDEVIRSHKGIYLHEDTENGITHYLEEDFNSCYVLWNDKIYNLLFMYTEEAYTKWVYATNKMSNLIETAAAFKEAVKNKGYRVECFEKFKEEYKLFNKGVK